MAKNNYRGLDTPGGPSGYVAIDEDDGIGAGDTAYSLTLSTGKQNRIQGNTMYLSAGPNCMNFAPVANNSSTILATGDRPWSSIEWTSVGLWLVPVGAGFRGVQMGGIYNVQGNGTNLAGVRLKIEMAGLTKIVSLANTETGGSPQYKTLFADPSDGNFLLRQAIESQDAGGFIQFLVWVQSEDDGARAGVTTDVFGRNWYVESDGNAGGNFDDASSGNPDVADAMETQYLQTTVATPYIGKRWDILHNINPVAQTPAGVAALAIYPADAATNEAFEVQNFYNAYLQLRGLWLRPIYQRIAVIDLPKEALEGQLSFSGPIAQRQAQAQRKLFRRPTWLSAGPEGVLNTDANFEEFTGRDYPYRWPFVDGDNGVRRLIEDSIFLDTDDPSINVELLVICSAQRQPLVAAQAANRGVRITAQGFQGIGAGAGFDPSQPGMGTAVWDLELRVDQLVNVASPGVADWDVDTVNLLEGATGTGGLKSEHALPLHAAAYESQEPFLRQQAFMESHDPATTDLAFSYKEGQLWWQDVDNLVERISLAVTLTGFDTSTLLGRPVRVSLDVNLSTTIDVVFPSSQLNDDDLVRFAIVGYTISTQGKDA